MLNVPNQSIEEARKRLPAALAKVWTFDADSLRRAVHEMTPADFDRPGEHAEHVFAIQDGLRVIVSREQDPAGAVVLHVSASCTPRYADRFRGGEIGAVFQANVEKLLGVRIPRPVLVTPRGVVHWVERWNSRRLAGLRAWLEQHAEGDERVAYG